MTEVLVVGSLMMDLITYAPALPKTGETVFGTSFQTSFGGKGANQAVQAARLGCKTAMIGCVGADSYGTEYLAQLSKEGVGVSNIIASSASGTGTASIQVNAEGQNTIIIVQGANLQLQSSHVAATESLIESANVVLCQNEISFETTKETLILCRKHKTVSVLNPAPASSRMLELLPLCDIFSPNETELASLTGMPTDTDANITAAAEKLLTLGCKIVVVTLGERGAFMSRAGESRFFPVAHRVEAVDTVGAGDSFLGSLAANLARGATLDDAVPRAIYCAAQSVTKKGAQGSCPTLQDLQQLQLSDAQGCSYAPPITAADKATIGAALGLY